MATLAEEEALREAEALLEQLEASEKQVLSVSKENEKLKGQLKAQAKDIEELIDSLHLAAERLTEKESQLVASEQRVLELEAKSKRETCRRHRAQEALEKTSSKLQSISNRHRSALIEIDVLQATLEEVDRLNDSSSPNEESDILRLVKAKLESLDCFNDQQISDDSASQPTVPSDYGSPQDFVQYHQWTRSTPSPSSLLNATSRLPSETVSKASSSSPRKTPASSMNNNNNDNELEYFSSNGLQENNSVRKESQVRLQEKAKELPPPPLPAKPRLPQKLRLGNSSRAPETEERCNESVDDICRDVWCTKVKSNNEEIGTESAHSYPSSPQHESVLNLAHCKVNPPGTVTTQHSHE
mmetsp:Transcript_3935/g.7606  ORF Transcript_3935/g.7606 Transcript_3935/m.7606 type:complete len:356 (+) Transcript_3935:397-1464(+)